MGTSIMKAIEGVSVPVDLGDGAHQWRCPIEWVLTSQRMARVNAMTVISKD
jgi:hypothetical protein